MEYLQNNYYLILGPSQSGKTSFINFFGSSMYDNIIEENNIWLFSENINIDPKEMFKKIHNFLNENLKDNVLCGIIYVQSSSGSSIAIDLVIEILSELFNLNQEDIKNNILIIFTKWDDLSEKSKKNFYEKGIGKIVEKLKIAALTWENKDIEKEEIERQKINFYNKINNLKTIFLGNNNNILLKNEYINYPEIDLLDLNESDPKINTNFLNFEMNDNEKNNYIGPKLIQNINKITEKIKTKVFLVIGPKLNGKTSFIDYFDNIEEKKMFEENEDLIKMKYRNIENNEVIFIDTPGTIFDENLKDFSKLSQYFKVIKEIDGIIYVQCALQSEFQIKSVIEILSKMFNLDINYIQQCILVLISKWDEVSEKAKKYFFEKSTGKIIKEINLLYELWSIEEITSSQTKNIFLKLQNLKKIDISKITIIYQNEINNDMVEKELFIKSHENKIRENKELIQNRRLSEPKENLIDKQIVNNNETFKFKHELLIEKDNNFIYKNILNKKNIIEHKKKSYFEIKFPKSNVLKFTILETSKKLLKKSESIECCNLEIIFDKHETNVIHAISTFSYDENKNINNIVIWEINVLYQLVILK